MLIKAVAGGGGKGMRVAANDLALKTPCSKPDEAEAAFGNGTSTWKNTSSSPAMSKSKCWPTIMATCPSLGTRLQRQRRHQKLIEESPSTKHQSETRDAMCEAADD